MQAVAAEFSGCAGKIPLLLLSEEFEALCLDTFFQKMGP
jgi:hypothetical protein